MPSLWPSYLPAIPGTSPKQYAVLDAIRFPSDDASTVLEDNHVMFKFRSDSSAIVAGAEKALFEDTTSKAYIGDLFELTSKRIGFLGRGFTQPSIGRTLALAAGVPDAAAANEMLIHSDQMLRKALAELNVTDNTVDRAARR